MQHEDVSVQQASILSGEVSIITLEDDDLDDLHEIIDKLSAQPNVEYAEPLVLYKSQNSVNDAYYSKTGVEVVDYFQWNFARINLEEAWGLISEKGNNEIKVAVIDTGVAFEDYYDSENQMQYRLAPELAHVNFSSPKSYQSIDCSGDVFALRKETNHPNDDHGHGTHVTGTIVQATNNATHAAGIAMNTTIIPLKILHQCDEGQRQIGTSLDLAEAIIFAVDQGANIINMSLGGSEYSQIVADAISYADENGVIMIAAAGNDASRDSSSPLSYPAAYSEVISVGATRWDNIRAVYSQYQPNNNVSLDLVAPGGQWHNDDSSNVLDQNEDGLFDGIVQQTIKMYGSSEFTEITDDYFDDIGYFCVSSDGVRLIPDIESCGLYQGTSMAAPHVSGVVALMLSLDSELSSSEVRRILKDTANKNIPQYNQTEYGAGLLDAYAALVETIGDQAPLPTSIPTTAPTTVPTTEPPTPTSACSAAGDCDDNNECTINACVFPGEPSSFCKTEFLEGKLCDSQQGFCDQNGECVLIDQSTTLLSLTIKLSGVPYCEGSRCSHPQKPGLEIPVQVTLFSSMQEPIRQTVAFEYDGSTSSYKTKPNQPISFENIPEQPYQILIKGPRHLEVRYCYFGDKASNRCTFQDLVDATNNFSKESAAEAKFIWLEPGKINKLNLAAYPVPAGDLPISGDKRNIQDKKVNVKDYSFLLSCLGEKSRTETCLSRADLDYSGQVNNIDLGLLRKTLSEIADQF